MVAVTEVLALTALVVVLAGLLAWGQRRYRPRTDPVVDAINDLLPQTQCAQCGYPGCRPYAEAVAAGAPLDLCPPGGSNTQHKLARLLGRDAGPPLPVPGAAVARIDESCCIGCFLCVQACPVDAIVGASRYTHTVISERCTGCELCLPPCPVDCIDLRPADLRPADLLSAGLLPLSQPVPATPEAPAAEPACIRCHRCEDACPESLPVERLWWTGRGDDLNDAVTAGLENCIECGLCNPVCPSSLDLVGTFRAARRRLRREADLDQAAALARRHADERLARLAREAAAADRRRAARLATLETGNGPG